MDTEIADTVRYIMLVHTRFSTWDAWFPRQVRIFIYTRNTALLLSYSFEQEEGVKETFLGVEGMVLKVICSEAAAGGPVMVFCHLH